VLRDHRDDTMGADAFAKRSFSFFDVPAAVQFGTQLKSQDRAHRQRS
jgi:hypothetical protein